MIDVNRGGVSGSSPDSEISAGRTQKACNPLREKYGTEIIGSIGELFKGWSWYCWRAPTPEFIGHKRGR
ncbi:MAG: hypothetical protein CMJ62_04935 [Planctomycetaceae bacterium]|nr:hypothetical protein [Planctomycetaceae bacterium]